MVLARRGYARWLGLVAGLFVATAAHAQSYPNRPVRIIVPFAAGGLNDTVARLLQPHLEKSLGQPVVIDNRPGASGVVGSDVAAKAPPDGHTLLMVASTHTVNPAVNAKLPYDTEKDLVPIAMVAQNSFLFLVNPKTEARSVQDFVKLAKANAGKFNYATPGAASQAHLLIELFSQRAGIKMQQIPYRGGAPAILSTVQGDTQLTVMSPIASLAQVQSGAVRVIAVSSAKRDPQFPDYPTVAESGYPDFGAVQWVALLTTAGTPKEIVDRLNADVNRALRDPDMIAKLNAQGTTPAGGTSEEMQAIIVKEVREWTEAARSAGIKAE